MFCKYNNDLLIHEIQQLYNINYRLNSKKY